jgi:hypothetical protein
MGDYTNGLGQVLKTQLGAAQTDMAETDFRLPGLASIPISPSIVVIAQELGRADSGLVWKKGGH